MKPLALTLLLAVAAAGCADEFDPYEDVRTPRLLAIAAEPPALAPGDSTTVSTLTTEPATAYAWSWCPLVGPSTDGYPCAVDHDQLQDAVDQALGEGQLEVPAFDLGTGDTATLAHDVPPEVWSGLCEVLRSSDLPGDYLPDCVESFPVTIKVELTVGGVQIAGTREVDLLYDAADPANANPVATAAIAIDPDTGDELTLDDAGTVALRRGVEYGLRLEVADSEAEAYGDAVEYLRISWFHQGGELDHAATGSNATTPLVEARENTWTTPLTDDWSDTSARLFFVLRDDRGGTSWLERRVELLP